MKTIAITRYRGGLLLLCGLMLFLIAPQLAQAQGVPPAPTVPEPPTTYETKNGTVIEEPAAPAVRRRRVPRPQDTEPGQRSPKEPHEQDAPSNAVDVTEPLDVPTPITEAPLPTSTDDKAVVPAALAKKAPVVSVPDEPIVLGLDAVLPDHLREGKVDALTLSMHADGMPVPTHGDVPVKPVDAKRIQGAQTLAAVADETPDDFALEANYPNPFNPQTTIRFAIPEASYVRIQVFDLLGREVAMLVDGTLSAGRHEVVFDATGLATGLYVYRMDAGAFEQHRTMLLMK